MSKIDPEVLIQAGAHFGHQTRRWNPKMKSFLYGEDNGIHIFDLVKTSEILEEVLKLFEKAGDEGKRVIFVGTKKQAKEKIKEVAQATGQFYVVERWLGGTLTNFEQIKRTLKKLEDTKEKKTAGEFKTFTKKENLMIDRDIARMERFLSGLKGMTEIPDLMFAVDVKKEAGAIKEAKKVGIETIAIVDSNSDPDLVDYVIPMNDDANKAIAYILDLIADAYLSGVKKSLKSSSKTKSKK